MASLFTGCYDLHSRNALDVTAQVAFGTGVPASGLRGHLELQVYGRGSAVMYWLPRYPEGCFALEAFLTGYYVFEVTTDSDGGIALRPQARDAAWEATWGTTDDEGTCHWLGRVVGSIAAPVEGDLTIDFATIEWAFATFTTPASPSTCAQSCAAVSGPDRERCQSQCFRSGELLKSLSLSAEEIRRMELTGRLDLVFDLATRL